ncbi:MAG: riboflavin synthase [Endomicrobium sp.]|jgi:riboflavin synthase|nr:riboflavin synthase [Endomicrobium sp.]
MFTGLIEDIGVIKNISSSRIEIETTLNNISKGDSVSVNGVCLTAVSINKNIFAANYSPHTDKITTLSKLKKDSKVNLERSLTLSSKLGGHIVSGHVDGTAKIEKIEALKEFYKIKFLCEKNILNYCVSKGSISVDGISLTIASILDHGFEIFIIPKTFDGTIMQLKKANDEVNIETDIFAKYVEKFTKKETSSIFFEMLKRNGFME